MTRYQKNLKIEGEKVYSYNTHVATIKGNKLIVLGHWSMTTSKHINYIATEYNLTKVKASKEEKEAQEETKNNKDNGTLKSIAMIAKMGEIFGKTTKEKNDWKERMLKAGLENRGLMMPNDWETLNEDEKERRLNGAIAKLR